MKFKTLGCRLNTFETETIKSITEKLDYKNLTFVNTCSVTKEAAKNSKKYVRQLKKQLPTIGLLFQDVIHISRKRRT